MDLQIFFTLNFCITKFTSTRIIAVHRVDPDLSVIARGLNCFNRYKPKTGKEKAVCLKRRKNLAKIGTKY